MTLGEEVKRRQHLIWQKGAAKARVELATRRLSD
jgi:hypothetical protein